MIELTISKNSLSSALLAIAGAVDKKQSVVILSNILVTIDDGRLLLTATDLGIEISASLPYVYASTSVGQTTIPAKKFIDIIRSLDEDELKLYIDATVVTVKSGRSQFKLSTLPADKYPALEIQEPDVNFSIDRIALLNLIQSTYFAMAQQDVRVFINSLLLEIDGNMITAVAMDGHRMAVSRLSGEFNFTNQQFLIPRHGVLEIVRVLNLIEDPILTINAGKGFFKIYVEQLSFITKLTEAKFPRYRKLIPTDYDKFILIDRDVLKRSLLRISILANEKTHGVLLNTQSGSLALGAKNQEQEEAQELLEATVDGQALKVGVNATYLLDVLNYFAEDLVRLSLSTMGEAIIVESLANENYQYIIMPMKL